MLVAKANEDQVLVLKDAKGGRGVYISHSLSSGVVILEFQGKIVGENELPLPYDSVPDHYLQIGPALYLGPSGDIDDFINHSCNPNCGLVFEGIRVFLISLRKIAAEEELTFDYSTTMDGDSWEMNCHCGDERCRGVIRNFVTLPVEVQSRYLQLGIVPEYIALKLQV